MGFESILQRLLRGFNYTSSLATYAVLVLGPLLVLVGLKPWQLLAGKGVAGWLDDNAENSHTLVGLILLALGIGGWLTQSRRFTHSRLKAVRDWRNRNMIRRESADQYERIILGDYLGQPPDAFQKGRSVQDRRKSGDESEGDDRSNDGK